jgi:glutamate racemase
VIATPATVRSHAYFSAIKDENPAVEVYEHATPAFVPMVEAGELDGPAVEEAVRDALAPLLGERDSAGDFIFPLPASARIDTLLLGCTHYPLLRPVLSRVTGDGLAIVDSATATASALAELLSINGLEASDASDGHSHTSHEVLTTGDLPSFERVARLMFGAELPPAVSIELRAAVA